MDRSSGAFLVKEGCFLDRYFAPAGFPDSVLHRFEPRVKTVSIFCFIALVCTLTFWPALLLAALFLAVLGALAGLSPLYFGRRLLWVLPFAGIMLLVLPFTVPGETLFRLGAGAFAISASKEGMDQAVVLSLRVLNAVLALNLLTATTGLRGLMDALRKLRVPLVFVQLLEFTVRYLFVLVEELQRMSLARRARGFQTGRSFFHKRTFLTLGQLLGVLFLRSVERGERIYFAMLSRGLGNRVERKELSRPRAGDLGWGVCITFFALALHFFEPGGWLWQTLSR